MMLEFYIIDGTHAEIRRAGFPSLPLSGGRAELMITLYRELMGHNHGLATAYLVGMLDGITHCIELELVQQFPEALVRTVGQAGAMH